MNASSFLVSHIRASLAATVQSTNSLVTSIKTSLGLVANGKAVHDQNHNHDAITYSREVEVDQFPRGHERYPSAPQSWKTYVDRRLNGLSSTDTYPRSIPTMPLTPNYSAPRYPIVLCHGLFGFDKMGPDALPYLQIHYWSGIQKALVKLGAKVIVTGVPRTGAIKKRAEDLHKMLSTSMEGMSVNFLAHSMGGLDCRYLISHIHDRNYHVNSLTTLSTPHRGSPFMDWCRDNIGVGLIQKTEEETMQKLGECARQSRTAAQQGFMDMKDYLGQASATSPPGGLNSRTGIPQGLLSPLLTRLIPLLDTPAYSNLTTEFCKDVFNPNTPDDPNVSYYSYGASVPQIPLWQPLGLPWEVIRAKEGDNDGLVSTASAQWGQYIETVEADHWDLNNRWRLKIGANQKPFDAIELYMNVATRLFKEGF